MRDIKQYLGEREDRSTNQTFKIVTALPSDLLPHLGISVEKRTVHIESTLRPTRNRPYADGNPGLSTGDTAPNLAVDGL